LHERSFSASPLEQLFSKKKQLRWRHHTLNARLRNILNVERFHFLRDLIPLDHTPVLQWSMARGWESKGIEEQQAEHSGSAPAANPRRTPAEVARTRQKDDLELRRQHVLQQLEVVRNARHQQLLKETLSFLDQQISILEKIS